MRAGFMWVGVAFGVAAAGTRVQAFPMTDGMEASDVIGQPDFATALPNDFVPSDIAIDVEHDRIFVSDLFAGQVLVFASRAELSGATAQHVLGGPSSLGRVWSVSWDATNQRLYAADPDHHRVLAWTLADGGGIVDGSDPDLVLGECSDGAGDGAIDACGMAGPTDVAIDEENRRIFVSDTQHNRVLVFDDNQLYSGAAAYAVLGQSTLTTGEANQGCDGAAAPGYALRGYAVLRCAAPGLHCAPDFHQRPGSCRSPNRLCRSAGKCFCARR